MNRVVVEAYRRGYRITDSGHLICSNGRERHCCPDRYGYNTSTIRMPGQRSNCRRLYWHKLAAYQKFGLAALAKGVQVRHLDGDPSNTTLINIDIGTPSQNRLDMPAEKRKALAGRASRKWDDDTDCQIRNSKIDVVVSAESCAIRGAVAQLVRSLL
jgi:hypothetical protein